MATKPLQPGAAPANPDAHQPRTAYVDALHTGIRRATALIHAVIEAGALDGPSPDKTVHRDCANLLCLLEEELDNLGARIDAHAAG